MNQLYTFYFIVRFHTYYHQAVNGYVLRLLEESVSWNSYVWLPYVWTDISDDALKLVQETSFAKVGSEFTNNLEKYAGVISDVSFVSIDPSGRSDLLKIIDQAQSSGSIALLHCLEPDSHRISIARHHIRVWTIATQRVELRVPLHIIASVGYIQDDGIHIICINIGPDPRNRQIRDLVILVAANKVVSEEVCSVLSSRFQAVYREAVVGLTDAKTFKGSFPQSASNSHGRGRGSVPLDSAETKTSLYTTSDSNNDAVSEYLALASASLNELEFREYAELLHRSKYGELPLRELAHKLMELFGPGRKHLLTRLHLLIRDEDQAEFREFLELHNITDSEEGTHQYAL